MAKKTWNKPIDKNVDWGGDANTGGDPVSGAMVQKFIKDTFNEKVGDFYYDTANNRYLVFADRDAREQYLADPSQTHLILGTFDAPFNYSAEITLNSPSYNAVFLGSTGNYIDFSFDIKNKQGASTGENAIITYTFIRNATKEIINDIGKLGAPIRLNVDKYLGEGTNTIIIGITGQTTLAATTVAITYQVVNLGLTDSMDISRAYNLSSGSQTVEIPFTVSGYGTKIVEWYLDGVQQPFVKADDEVVDASTSRTKRITISNLQQGRHSLQFRAYTTVNGERFYTDTLYRDLLVYTGINTDVLLGVAVTIPKAYGVLGANDPVMIYDMVQYVPYTLRFASYSPLDASNTDVSVFLGNKLVTTVGSSNGKENRITLMASSDGMSTVSLQANNVSYDIATEVKKSNTSLQEITNELVLDFNANGKSNFTTGKEEWSYNGIIGTLTGFNWNNASGWVNGRLEINAGATLAIDYAPLGNNPTSKGKTIEIEWATKNVSDENAVICDLRNSSGVGILITATKVSMTSADGVVVETEYKSDENVRIAFVINRSSGVTNQRLSFIYADGTFARGAKWAINDSYTSNTLLSFQGTKGAEISLKSIRVYDNALSSDQILNNYTLYRDSIAEMMEVYDRNDVYVEGSTTFSPDKMAGRLPVMVITGDIPTLENTSDSDTQITVDIEYTNIQDPTRSFKMTKAIMRPQGTSSMGYPKKNFRIYTQRGDDTVLYDANGNVVEDKLYAFKAGAQPVDCWCLKADYAESSGTHNTGIARLWNDALVNARVTYSFGDNDPRNIDNEPVLRTRAQQAAMDAGYPYDVRTTIDGFPILLFYRPSANDDIIFIGKYNFNNDKSTESVFGFTGIPNFNNERMQCWEILNNGHPFALFTTTEGFHDNWSEAFESRYPDTKSPNITDLRAFCEWMTEVSQEDFAAQKWNHLNVYMMAAYWVYLMRHAAADQFVKNAMLTSEDGTHFYFILYDNDTINGLINTGHLEIEPTDTRQTKNMSDEYVFAGHDSKLWNMLEADQEFMAIVSEVDNALYSAGISYANAIKVFDEEQADKWVERVYNQDAQYKYIGPYTEKGIDNLFMLQGNRSLHRKWWLAKRFSIYDAKYVSGTYKSQAIEVKCINNTEPGLQFSVTAGYPLDYGYGINNKPREYGVSLNVGESVEFTTKETVNRGDPIRIYGAPHIACIDFSKIISRLAVVTIDNVYDEALGTRLTKLILGKEGSYNYEVAEISGLPMATALEELDVTGMEGIKSLDLTAQTNFKTLKSFGSGVSSITFAKGSPVERLELSSSMRYLSLEELPYLTTDNLLFEAMENLEGMTIMSCPNISNKFTYIYNWYLNKKADDSRCSIIMDNVNWSGVKGSQLAEIVSIALNGGIVSLKGKVRLTEITEQQGEIFIRVFGENVFNESSEFYIYAPTTVSISGPSSVLEGEIVQYSAKAYPPREGVMSYSLIQGRSGCSIDKDTGVLSTIENGEVTSDIIIRATFVASDGTSIYSDMIVPVAQRIYPLDAAITTNENILDLLWASWDTQTPGVNGKMIAEWTLTGDIIDYVEIEDSNDTICWFKETYFPVGVIKGVISLKLKKAYNKETILTTTLEVYAERPEILMTSRSNPGVQKSLYDAGLVVNEDYTLKREAELITADQLRPNTGTSGSIFYSQSKAIQNFDEFRYFTSVTTIKDYTFYGTSIKSIILPESVVSIEKSAFSQSTDITYIYISKTVTDIKAGAFNTQKKMNFEVDPSNSAYSAIDGVLFNKAKTTLIRYSKDQLQATYSIPEGTITIGESAFESNYSLTEINIPNSVTSIASTCFANCTALTFVDLPDSITQLGEYIFYGCSNLLSVKLPNNIAQIPSQAFYNCKKLDSITIPASVIRLGSQCFHGCVKLKTIASNAITAPSIVYQSFGSSSSNYVGSDITTEKFLKIPLNATGYGSGEWSSTLQNPSKCNFTLYGKFEIASNKSDAKFEITYTTEDGITKSGIVGVGICYLGEIYEGATITILATSSYPGEACEPKTVIYSNDIGEQVMNFETITGVFIHHIDGGLLSLDAWKSLGAIRSEVNGVAVIVGTNTVVISLKDNGSGKWSSDTSTTIEGIVTSTDNNVASKDMNGKSNTDILVQKNGVVAAVKARNYTFPNGEQGYLPAYGELLLVASLISKVDNVLNQVGGDSMDIANRFYWSSTQGNGNSAYMVCLTPAPGRGSNHWKANSQNIRPFMKIE